jgi:tetrahydromethanopterin S-methyltransferase subunit A
MLGFYPLASAPIADDANVSVSVTLSGVQATGQLGTAAVYAEAIVNPNWGFCYHCGGQHCSRSRR